MLSEMMCLDCRFALRFPSVLSMDRNADMMVGAEAATLNSVEATLQDIRAQQNPHSSTGLLRLCSK